MAKVNENSEKLANRLVDIIRRLNLGESFTKAQLAEDYKVSERTIQRDLDRLVHLDIECKGQPKKYFLDPLRLGKFNKENLEQFSKITGTEHLFPDLNKNLVNNWVKNEPLNFFVNGYDYEQSEQLKKSFDKLQQQIKKQEEISFL